MEMVKVWSLKTLRQIPTHIVCSHQSPENSEVSSFQVFYVYVN